MSAQMRAQAAAERFQARFGKFMSGTRDALEKFEHDYARPGIRRLVLAFRRRPLRTTFLTIFAVISFLPILSFAGFTLFILGALIFFALSCAHFVSSAITLFSGTVLAFTLMFIVGITTFLTTMVLAAYFAFRLMHHVRNKGPQRGTIDWFKELREKLLYSVEPTTLPPTGTSSARKPPYSQTKAARTQAGRTSNKTGDDDFVDASSQPISSGRSDTSTADSTVVVEGLDQDHHQRYHGDEPPLFGAGKPYTDFGLASDEKPPMGIGGDSPIMVKKELES